MYPPHEIHSISVRCSIARLHLQCLQHSQLPDLRGNLARKLIVIQMPAHTQTMSPTPQPQGAVRRDARATRRHGRQSHDKAACEGKCLCMRVRLSSASIQGAHVKKRSCECPKRLSVATPTPTCTNHTTEAFIPCYSVGRIAFGPGS